VKPFRNTRDEGIGREEMKKKKQRDEFKPF